MSTQKDKFSLFSRLGALGFTYEESASLRRIEMTLHRWAEQECGDGNACASWAIERDETTGKPFRCVYPHSGKEHRHAISDLEAGALKRLGKIIGDRNTRVWVESGNPSVAKTAVSYYHHGDCRGCSLYIIRPGDVPEGKKYESFYTNGIAVCT